MTTVSMQLGYRFIIGKPDKDFFVEDGCNGCRVCEKVCPVHNIKVERKPRFVHHCLQNAIRLVNEKSRVRLINPTSAWKKLSNLTVRFTILYLFPKACIIINNE